MDLFPEIIEPSAGMPDLYWSLFINQTAYSLMSDNRSEPEINRYYRPKLRLGSEAFKELTKDTIRRHLRGEVTCMFYAANPDSQSCKWVCLDADYPLGLQHLSVLQDQFLKLGLFPLMEQSRRGGHLWLLAETPLSTVQVRAFVLHTLSALDLPLFDGDVQTPGIEVFPRQNYLESGRFGNGVRGPLGVHRKDFKRYWFTGAKFTLSAQLNLLLASRTLTQERLDRFTDGLAIPPQVTDKPLPFPSSVRRSAFSIFDYFPIPTSSTGDYKVVCPACTAKRLVISVRGSRRGFYHCFSGCPTGAIRAALGQPLSGFNR